MERIVAYAGKKFKIAYAIDSDGSVPGHEFFKALDKANQAKLSVLFALLADHQSTRNPEKFGDLGGGLFEFKSFQIRMPYAYAREERALVLIAHGFLKKRGKAPRSEIERAWRILEQDPSMRARLRDRRSDRKE
ncbi:MAG: type II toxin-antitoxin system RelE/ParE family toxin [Bryobacterales bacterium]|nr:type II toxin-antitoxin system RelE/ParE family toxin [Bryobacterales bacterium]